MKSSHCAEAISFYNVIKQAELFGVTTIELTAMWKELCVNILERVFMNDSLRALSLNAADEGRRWKKILIKITSLMMS